MVCFYGLANLLFGSFDDFIKGSKGNYIYMQVTLISHCIKEPVLYTGCVKRSKQDPFPREASDDYTVKGCHLMYHGDV